MSSSEWSGVAPQAFEPHGAAAPREFVELPLAAPRAAGERAAPNDTAAHGAELTLAFERGRSEGAAEAEARHAASTARALAALEAALAAQAAREAQALAEWPRRALELARDIAERIVRRTLAEDLGRLTPCLDEALAQLEPRVAPQLSLAPQDLALAERCVPLMEWARATGVELRADASVARAEAALADGPARVELRWAAVAERLRAALEEQLTWAEGAP